MLAILAVAALQAGCATALVNAAQEDAGHPIAELGGMERPLQGLVLEHAEVDGMQYVRIALPDARQSCQRTEPLELLVPASDGAKYSAILREGAINPPTGTSVNVLVYGMISSRPPGLPDTGSLPKDKELTDWLSRLDLSQKPISPIVLGYDQRMGLKAFYRLGQDVQPRVTTIDIKTDWVCRSHIKHASMTLLYLPAVAFDVVTFPVQLVVLLVTAH